MRRIIAAEGDGNSAYRVARRHPAQARISLTNPTGTSYGPGLALTVRADGSWDLTRIDTGETVAEGQLPIAEATEATQ